MDNKKKMCITILSLASVSMGVIYYNLKNDTSIENISSVSSTDLLNVIEGNDSFKYSNIVKDYNLGNRLLGEKEEAISVKIKGTIGVPKNITNTPIIFIMSGNNNSSIETNSSSNENSYKGLRYLVDSLSKAGYLTILINTELSVEEDKENYIVEDKILNLIFEEHLKCLKDSISGTLNKYPIPLYNKGDLNNIGLIGQSNTGRTIYNIANQQLVKNKNNIKGLLSITPNGGIPISSYPDIPSSILSTEHSIDTNIGFDMYNDIEKSIGRESFSHITYLIGGDSNKFNNLVKNDTINSNINTINSNRMAITTNEDTIQDESIHQEFLSYYSVDFFNYIFKKDLNTSLYNNASATAQKLYKKDILSKLYTSNRRELFNANIAKDLKINFNNIKTKNVVESSISSLDTAIDFNEPATNIELPLLQLDWKSKKSSFNLDISNSYKDFSEHKSISIEWALNHASQLSMMDMEKVSIILSDGTNKSEVVLLDELPLNMIKGTSEAIMKDDKITSNWSRFTPIAETRVPLDLFKGINLKSVSNISINFNENQSGSIYLKNIYLNK